MTSWLVSPDPARRAALATPSAGSKESEPLLVVNSGGGVPGRPDYAQPADLEWARLLRRGWRRRHHPPRDAGAGRRR